MQKTITLTLSEFEQTINNAMNFEKMDINDLLLEVSNSEEVDEKVKKEALRRIGLIQMMNMTGE